MSFNIRKNYFAIFFGLFLAIDIILILSCSGPTSVSGDLPETCKDAKEKALDETGERLANGNQTLYVNGDESQPWEAYCHNMNREEPLEYLTVEEDSNYSQSVNSEGLIETKYRRYRINPDRLEINPNDKEFATTTSDGDDTDLRAGKASFTNNSTGSLSPRAKAEADLTGSGFIFAEEIDDDGFFCKSDGEENNGGDKTDSLSEYVTASDLSQFTLKAFNQSSGQTSTVSACDEKEESNAANIRWPLEYVGELD